MSDAPEVTEVTEVTEVQVYDFRKPQSAHQQREGAPTLTCPVFFVGFMGAGKTSVARKLARSARVASIDMDTFLERSYDKKIRDIFAESGEEGFRSIETEVLLRLATGEPQLISCGGGVVLSERNREILKEHGFVVYLKVTAAEAASRISDVSTRPLFGDLENAQRVIESRLPLYEDVADIAIDTAGLGTGAIAHEAYGLLKRRGIIVSG